VKQFQGSRKPLGDGLFQADAGPFELDLVETPSGQIEFGQLGEGPIVLMLSGRGGAGTEQFGKLALKLAECGFRGVAVNPRGVSRSVAPMDGLSLHDMARDAAHVLERFDEPAHVVGLAHGNRVARCLAMDFPNLAKSTTLVGAGGLVPPRRPPMVRGSAAARRPLRPKSRDWQSAFDAHEHAARSTPLSEWWPGGRAPTLVVQGLVDHVAPPENGRRLAAEAPERVRLIEIEGAGHFLFRTHLDEVIGHIVAFIEEKESGRAPN
jgi:pimeloyl-ACP methyl ester carboxylesterase